MLIHPTREYKAAPWTNDPSCDPEAWDIIHAFATSDEMELPEAEKKLREHLGSCFRMEDWQPALDAVMGAEGDTLAALDALNDLQKHAIRSKTHLVIKIPPRPKPPQLLDIERDLSKDISNIQECRRIFRDPPSLDELIQPPEEEQVEDPDVCPDNDEDFIASVDCDVAIEHGEIIEDESDSDKDDMRMPDRSNAEVMELCQMLEGACIDRLGEVDGAPTVLRAIRRFRGHLQKAQIANARQTTLDHFWK